MILFGTVLAAAAGVALPSHMILFGLVISEFVTYGIVNGNTLLQNATSSLDQTCSPAAIFSSPAYIEYVNSSDSYFCVSDPNVTDAITNNILRYACDPSETLRFSVGQLSFYYLAIAIGVLFALFFSNIFWNVSAYRQTRRIRLAFYKSVLRQELGWFDVNEASQLNTRLVE